jgi:hypothetical protein
LSLSAGSFPRPSPHLARAQVEAGLILHQGYIPDKIMQMKHKIPFTALYFLGVRGLKTSSYIVYDYATSGHTNL